MGCGLSSSRGTLSSGMLGQKHIMCPELRQDIHEDLGVTVVACSMKGWRKTQEDTSSIVINLGGRKDMLGVGVFDGHSGPEASRYVAANLWNEVTKTTEWADGDIDGALRAAFLSVDENMRTEKVSHGTTAVVAVLTPSYLYVANCGDSRAVLCKGGVATALSTDHKPNVYTEMARVIRCGGQVMTGEFGGVSRVTAPGAMVAMATSRSLGDFHFKRRYNSEPGEQVVSPAAEVTCQRRTEEDEFLILGTDGVWDVLSNQEVSEILRSSERIQRPSRSSDAATPSSILENHLGPSWPAVKTRRAGTITIGASRPSPAGTRYYSGADVDSVRDAATHSVTYSETAVTESSFRGRRGSSFSASTRSSPAFIRLFTPNLVRLRTPTSPEPPRVRRVQMDVKETEEGKQEIEERSCAAAAGSDAAPPVSVEEGAIAEESGINEEVPGKNGRPADFISRDFVVTEEVDVSGEQQTLPMSPASLARNIPVAHGAWEGGDGGGVQMASRSSSLSNSDSDSYFEGSEFGGGMTAITAVLSMRKRDRLDAQSHSSDIVTSPVTTKHAVAFEGVVNPSSEVKRHNLEGSGTEGNVCGVDEGGTSSTGGSASTSTCPSGPALTSIPAVGGRDGAWNSEKEGNDSRLASDGGLISTTGSSTSKVKGVAAAEPGINPGTSPAPAPASCPLTSSGACQVDVTPSSGNTPNPVNLTPFRNSGTPGGSSGSAPKTPSLRTTPPMYRSLRTPGVGNMGTPGRRGSSNSGTPNSWGSGRGGGSGSSRVGSMRRGSNGGMGSLFHRNTGGSSLSMSMTAKDSKGVIGAVRGALDRALQLGSQDNMTLIAVDLRGFLEPSPPPSTSSVQ